MTPEWMDWKDVAFALCWLAGLMQGFQIGMVWTHCLHDWVNRLWRR